MTFYHVPFYTLDLPHSGVHCFSFLFHGLQTSELSFMCTAGSRNTTASEVTRKKLHPANAFWDNSAGLYLQIIVGIQEACISINTPFLIFCYLYLHLQLLWATSDFSMLAQPGLTWVPPSKGNRKPSMLALR